MGEKSKRKLIKKKDMLASQFFICFVLIAIMGIIYIRTMMKMAVYNPWEKSNKNNVLKVFSIVFFLVAFVLLIVSIYLINKMQIPSQTIGAQLNKHTIIRPYPPLIGYPTAQQNLICAGLRTSFAFIGLGAYFLCFRESNSTARKKILKFVYGVLFYVFYVNASNLHYFDIWELIAPIIFIVMSLFVKMRSSNNKVAEQDFSDEANKSQEKKDAGMITTNDYSRFMPKNNLISEVSTEQNAQSMEQESKNILSPNESEKKKVLKYCRHCGNSVDYLTDRFCKYCGNQLN